MKGKEHNKSDRKKILLGVTGSIAAYKAGDIIRRLQDKGCDVTVVMTKAAEKFITPLTLQSLSGNKVYRKMFDDREEAWESSHIRLAQIGKVFLIAPASANTIAKMAYGFADNLLLCTALATKAKILVAPAMNENMYTNKIMRENLAKIKRMGIKIISPVKGKLACGKMGQGHLADVKDIVNEVVRCAK